MKARFFSSDKYKYGFNGMEKDDEISNKGRAYTADYWEYSSALGKRWNIDPVSKHHQSPYECFNNNPIFYNDPHGDEPDAGKAKRSVRKYERKFMRELNRNGNDIDAAHKTMAEKYNNRRWMWIKADEDPTKSGYGQDHGKYYNAGELFQESHPAYRETPPAPIPPPVVNISPTDVFAVPGTGSTIYKGWSYQVSGNGTASFTLTAGSTSSYNVTISQGNTIDPNISDLNNIINPTTNVNTANSPVTLSFSVNSDNGNYIYVEIRNASSASSSSLTGSPTISFAPTPPPPVVSKPHCYEVINGKYNRDVKHLNHRTRQDLIRQYNLNH